MKFGKLNLSQGNDKLGFIWNWNLQAGATCPMSCVGCYAMKGRHVFSKAQKPRIENTEYVVDCYNRNAMPEFIEQFNTFFKLVQPRLFRVHESGDFFVDKNPDIALAYAWAWYHIMQDNPDVHFNVFTKAYDTIREVPFFALSNCHMFLSSWIGLEIPEDLKKHYRVGWFKDRAGLECRIPDKGFICPGKAQQCIRCQHCFKDGKYDVVLREH